MDSTRAWAKAAVVCVHLALLGGLTVQGITSSAVGSAPPTCRGLPATIVGTSGRDDLVGRPGPDVIVALGGRDSVYGRGGADTICGGDGPDDLYGGRGSDVVQGGAGEDWLEDAFGANQALGGSGSDVLRSGRGDDRMNGGSGRDVVDYSALLDDLGFATHCRDITVDLTAGTGQGVGFGLDRLVAIEGAYSGGGDDVLIGDATPNTFYVGGILCGRVRSDDRVEGLGGGDTITFASELIEFGSADGRVQVDLRVGEAFSRGNGGQHFTTFTSVENIDGTEYRDTLTGNSAPNVFNAGWPAREISFTPGDVIHGLEGADRILGMGAKDELHGGLGSDVLRGRRGADSLYGNAGDDRLDGGDGTNENRGGAGFDTCLRPSAGPSARGCEAP